MEKFDKIRFDKNKTEGAYYFILPGGIHVRQWEKAPQCYIENSWNENSPYETYKEFYFNSGTLKISGDTFYDFKIGKWNEYDEKGDEIKERNYDESYQFSERDLSAKMHKIGVNILVKDVRITVSRINLAGPQYVVCYPGKESLNEVIILYVDGNTGATLSKKSDTYCYGE